MTLISRRIGLPVFAMLLAWQGRPPRAGVSAGKFDSCRLLSPGDAAVLVGDGATSVMTQGGQLCTWKSAGKMKLMVRTPESTRTKPEVTFDNYKTGPHTNYTIADEPDLGDHAVSAITPYGVEFMVLKKDRILWVQYFGAYGMKGTPEMLAKAKPVIKKAVDAF
jgi:hypothetical protein